MTARGVRDDTRQGAHPGLRATHGASVDRTSTATLSHARTLLIAVLPHGVVDQSRCCRPLAGSDSDLRQQQQLPQVHVSERLFRPKSTIYSEQHVTVAPQRATVLGVILDRGVSSRRAAALPAGSAADRFPFTPRPGEDRCGAAGDDASL